MSHYEIFKLCLIKYEEIKKEGQKKKWFFKTRNQFALVDLSGPGMNLYEIYIVEHKTIYSFMMVPNGTDNEDIVAVVHLNNSAIKFSGILGMSDFVHAENLQRIPIQGHYQSSKNNHLYWKTLFTKLRRGIETPV